MGDWENYISDMARAMRSRNLLSLLCWRFVRMFQRNGLKGGNAEESGLEANQGERALTSALARSHE